MMKKVFRTIHLYLGLASGLVLCVVCLTGAIMVFEKEMQEWLYHERYFVSNQGEKERKTLNELIATVAGKLPKADISFVKTYQEAGRTVEFTYSEKDNRALDNSKATANSPESGKEKGKGRNEKEGKRKEVKQAFVDPSTGDIVATFSFKDSFFKKVEMIHRKLLADEPGKQVVGASVILFVFILITGLVLWWPKNKKIMKQRLQVKISGSWKRLNHDLHMVIGFYASLFLLIIALTGLTFSYKWMSNGIYVVTGTNNKRPEPIKIAASKGEINFQSIYTDLLKKYPESVYYQFKMPQEDQDAIAVSVLESRRFNENAKDVLYYDRKGILVGQLLFKDLNAGHQIKSAMLPVHRGAIGGFAGKILVFLCAMAGATFPITGVILWINRINKNKKKSLKKVTSKSPLP